MLEEKDIALFDAFLRSIMIERISIDERKKLAKAFSRAIGYETLDKAIDEGDFTISVNPMAKNYILCVIMPSLCR